ncbi:MAG: beta-ketoacyl-[acyl-carrier-protein] synthase family protein [Desulfobulbaceae bacterium]|nr:beta-ketoacyl-[acyl-carrier-protein] synthase family protein [Desulfobulbaceae bacterium]
MKTVYIVGAGVISSLACGLEATEAALRTGRSGIGASSLFSLPLAPELPVGQASCLSEKNSDSDDMPRCHRLALLAAEQAVAMAGEKPRTLVVGCTTGGILTSENFFWRDDFFAPENESASFNAHVKAKYRRHGLTTVAEEIARRFGCPGPALTVSTACSSGAAAIALALALLRSGQATTALAGGVDSLSRLTCFGFHSLQLVDVAGCKPLDKNRRGINVAEGAAFLFLTTKKPRQCLGVVAGAGLSCDAYHASAPHPQGLGARAAMAMAIQDAGLKPEEIDYINLHGTGTADNDAAEAMAIAALFAAPPPLSSIKGATGHSLAACGGIEAVVSALAGRKGFIPGTTGCREPDAALGIRPQLSLQEAKITHVLSNSFGFGGNNAALVISQVDEGATALGDALADAENIADNFLAVYEYAAVSGVGLTKETLLSLQSGQPVAGRIAPERLCADLPQRAVRRLGRLTKLALTLAEEAVPVATSGIESIFWGSGWGALSETYNFLRGLAESAGRFTSPIDFVGSTHNSAAGRVAIEYQAQGKNLSFSGGDASFEQALFAAQTMIGNTEKALLLAADEGHDRFSPLFDPSIHPDAPLADGGGGFFVGRDRRGAKCLMRLDFLGHDDETPLVNLCKNSFGVAWLTRYCAAIFAGIPQARQAEGERRLSEFLAEFNDMPVLRHRNLTGEFATAQAMAAALAVSSIEAAHIPGALFSDRRDDTILSSGQGILLLGFGTMTSIVRLVKV